MIKVISRYFSGAKVLKNYKLTIQIKILGDGPSIHF
jgi:hypothetical protein